MKIPVLDHGYVELIEAWGQGREKTWHSESGHDYEVGIIEAARQSTQGSFRGWGKEQTLLEFLHRMKHETPFEFAGMVLEVQAPIMVFREWHRHRIQSYNEASARYAPLPSLYYSPEFSVLMERASASTTNKQAGTASGGVVLGEREANQWLEELNVEYGRCDAIYKRGLKLGVPKELARLIMPVGHFSKMRASTNLRGWLAFETLRNSSYAQWEIRQYAISIGKILADRFPKTWELWLRAKDRLEDIEKLIKLVSELCESVDNGSRDIGGSRPSLTILQEIGPLVDKLEGR